MTCKDCIHYDICHNNFKNIDLNEEMTDEHCCVYFKDKSRFVELPCKVGDEVYYISIKRYSHLSYSILKAKVIYFCFNRNEIYAVKLKTLNSNFIITLPICKVYFDKSKAETKLKELNGNE